METQQTTSQLFNLLEPAERKRRLGDQYVYNQQEEIYNQMQEEDENLNQMMLQGQGSQDVRSTAVETVPVENPEGEPEQDLEDQPRNVTQQPPQLMEAMSIFRENCLANLLFQGQDEEIDEEFKKFKLDNLANDRIVLSILSTAIFENFAEAKIFQLGFNQFKQNVGCQAKADYKSLDDYKEVMQGLFLLMVFCNLTANPTAFIARDINIFAASRILNNQRSGTHGRDRDEEECLEFVYNDQYQNIELKAPEEEDMDYYESTAYEHLDSLESGDVVLLVAAEHSIDHVFQQIDRAQDSETCLIQMFELLVKVINHMNENQQNSASLILGYVQVWKQGELTPDVSILINSDPNLHANFKAKQSLTGSVKMRLFVIQNVSFFQRLDDSFVDFDSCLEVNQVGIRPFFGLKMLLSGGVQKPVLYRKANALDRDQGQMERYICNRDELNIVLDSQKRVLKHISTLTEGDISMVMGGPGTGKTFTAIEAILMFLKTKTQRVCMLLPDGTSLERFIQQLNHHEGFLSKDDYQRIKDNTIIVSKHEIDEVKNPKYKELYADIKSLSTFLDLPLLPDRQQLVEHLGYKRLRKVTREFDDVINNIQAGRATEELLRMVLKNQRVALLDDLLDIQKLYLHQSSERRERLEHKVQRLVKLMMAPEQLELFKKMHEEDQKALDDEMAESFPEEDFSEESKQKGGLSIEVYRIYRSQQRVILIQLFQDHIENLNEQLYEIPEYKKFKTQILPAIKRYLLSTSRVVISSVRDDILSPQQLIVSTEKLQKRIFDAVIVDNAHQVPELETTLILNNLRPGKVILFGDTWIPSESSAAIYTCIPFFRELQFNRSLFERLIISGGGPIVLNQQVRMNKQLLEFISRCVDQQVNQTPIHGLHLRGPDQDRIFPKSLNPIQRVMPYVCFYDLKYLPELRVEANSSDQHECFFVLSLLSKLARICIDLEKKSIIQEEPEITQHELRRVFPHGISIQKVTRCSIGVIIPFAHLLSDYRRILARLQFVSNLDVQVGLPHEFQGVEKDIIIVSHLRNSQVHKMGSFCAKDQHSESYDPLKNINLSLTRSKKYLWFVGNLQQVVPVNRHFRNLSGLLHKNAGGMPLFQNYQPFESQDQWRDRDHFGMQLFSHCSKLFRGGGLRTVDQEGRNFRGVNRQEEAKIEQKLLDMGSNVLSAEQKESQMFEKFTGYTRDRNYMKRQESMTIHGGQHRRDAEGGQYMRLHKYNNYTHGGGQQRRPRFQSNRGRGGFLGDRRGPRFDPRNRQGDQNAAFKPRPKNVLNRLDDRFKDRNVTWDETEGRNWGGTGYKRQKTDGDQW